MFNSKYQSYQYTPDRPFFQTCPWPWTALVIGGIQRDFDFLFNICFACQPQTICFCYVPKCPDLSDSPKNTAGFCFPIRKASSSSSSSSSSKSSSSPPFFRLDRLTYVAKPFHSEVDPFPSKGSQWWCVEILKQARLPIISTTSYYWIIGIGSQHDLQTVLIRRARWRLQRPSCWGFPFLGLQLHHVIVSWVLNLFNCLMIGVKNIPIYKQSQSRYHAKGGSFTKHKEEDFRCLSEVGSWFQQVFCPSFHECFSWEKSTCENIVLQIYNVNMRNLIIAAYLISISISCIVVTFLWKTICESLHPVACRVCLNKKQNTFVTQLREISQLSKDLLLVDLQQGAQKGWILTHQICELRLAGEKPRDSTRLFFGG